MKYVLLILLCLCGATSLASHIVGGEFELQHLQGNRYRLTLILYFDVINGSAGAKEQIITVRIFRKRDNSIMMEPQLTLMTEQAVAYTQPACSEGGAILTDKLTYTEEITLSDAQFSDPQGYYVAWERCCRNYSIVNIYSEDPNGPMYSGNFAGQTFYLEFPPVVKDGEPFINSTPTLFPPLNDYACPNREYYVDFAGTDKDGDSLHYSLVTPLNTFEASSGTNPSVLTRSGPYPTVSWRQGYSLNNITGGNPDLTISSNGFIRVVPPPVTGLYVFAVKCEEFRDGKKIGEVRRDFQMFVVDYCAEAVNPVITGRKLEDASFGTSLSVTLPNTATGDERCIEVKVTDDDVFRAEDNFKENIKIRAIPIGFRGDISKVLPVITTATLTKNVNEKVFKICFDECPFDPDGFSTIGIVAYDDACSLPLTDTLVVNIYLEPKPNTDPYFITNDVTQSVMESSETLSWIIEGRDDDFDPLEVVSKSSFVLADFGFDLRDSILSDGLYVSKLSWTPDCEQYVFKKNNDYLLTFLLNDNECDLNNPDTLVFDLTLLLPQNTKPTLSITSSTPALELTDQHAALIVNTPLHLLVHGADNDPLKHNEILLELVEATGTVAPSGFQFDPVRGIANVTAPFTWVPSCDIFRNNTFQNDYTFLFRVSDFSCTTPMTDTLALRLTVTDVDSKPEEFLPPNIITPNDDGLNDFFGLDEIQMTDHTAYLPKLPVDNCAGRFLNIRIFNRWGKEVFESKKRNFRWFPDNQAAGLYFYTIQYTNTEYKGTLTLRD